MFWGLRDPARRGVDGRAEGRAQNQDWALDMQLLPWLGAGGTRGQAQVIVNRSRATPTGEETAQALVAAPGSTGVSLPALPAAH